MRITPACDPITNVLYADDLLIFGKAEQMEALNIMNTLEVFSRVSGQQIGPAKSSIWFSRVTDPTTRNTIAGMLQVNLQAASPKYLGAPIATTAQAFDFLIEAFSARLNSWKTKLLSQAGRLILIKAVLQSIPIYYMTTTKIPKKVLHKLTGLIRRFFWDKVDKTRFLALIAWEKLTIPIGMGGLGLKNLETMNEALLMKMLWRLAAGSNALWAEQLRGKYLLSSDLWHSNRLYRCTNFWRGILVLRPQLERLVTWNLGDGTECTVYAQL